MEIKKNIKNDLFGRKEIEIILTAEKTPSFAEISKMLGEHFKAAEDEIMVENVKGKFGRNTFLIKACIYDSKALKDEAFKRLIKAKKVAVAAA